MKIELQAMIYEADAEPGDPWRRCESVRLLYNARKSDGEELHVQELLGITHDPYD